ncbi:hypothetical protein BD309DRAFT_1008335 [Dichomitus squalens]|uniref:Histone chaperone domain-containing protein n=1 Tax=Dichomitus squalens TaxID=114155 RepID=A0A4Q9NVY4_9APHY|nr:hypothetical protein BD311DRAFT_736080 [Dichomitus squalens]TBU45924.1 hypothetical protein BD309DRAFT_1008335 [Dichomitus squalens]TBU56813.1 hypothetical protein BD310DRAFT_593372 [Dichomitus squalens]
MSTDATSFSASSANGDHPAPTSPPASKGKGKAVQEDVIDDDDEDDEDDEEEEEDEDEEMAEEEDFEEIDPSVIINTGGRRTRGVRVDYTSPEALAKAGLKPEDAVEEDEHEEAFVAKDDEMHD